MIYEINKDLWHVCKICGKTIQELSKNMGGCGIYYKDVFLKHLKSHDCSIEEYFTKYCNIQQQKCPCGICNKDLLINKSYSNFKWNKFACGRNEGLLNWSEQAKTTRRGKNNPMFGKEPWNKNQTKFTSKSIENASNKLKNQIVSEETKLKQSISAKKRKIHGHTGKHHSEKTKDFLRLNTLRLIKEGYFKQTETKPVKEFKKILEELNIDYESEKQIHYWSFDIYLPKENIFIEIDGDYFHSNPRFYPNGPKTKTQKVNYIRDIHKNNYCIKNNIVLYRFWEYDILNNGDDIKQILCNLKK